MSQTSNYGFRLDVAQAGVLADAMFNDVTSRAAEGAVPFGVGVVLGTDPDKQVKTPVDGDSPLYGISVFSHAVSQGIDQSVPSGQYSTGAEYDDTATVSVLRKGRIYGEVTVDVDAGDSAYVHSVSDLGLFTYEVNTSITTFDADFVASNEIDLDINGTSITTVTFDDDHATTFAALVTEIESTLENNVSEVTRYTVVGDADARTIVIRADASIAVTNVAVTEGASQAESTVEETDHLEAGSFERGASADGLSVVSINLP